jgi:hypothetical protein
MGKWGTYPRNNGDPQCDYEEPEEPDPHAGRHEDEEIEHKERQRELKIERDNEKW